MKALCWHGKSDVRIDSVPDPKIQDPRDAIIRITSTAICGSDLHLYDGYVPTLEEGDVLGHEAMGRVVEVGRAVTKLRPGDRVVVPDGYVAETIAPWGEPVGLPGRMPAWRDDATNTADEQDAQFKLAAAIMDPAFQESFNLKKGSIPARTDVPDTNFDACGKKAIADAKEATANDALMGSMAHGHAASESVKRAVYDVVTEFFNSDMSSADAAKKLSQSVANAK